MKKYYLVSALIFLFIFSLRVFLLGGIPFEAEDSNLESAAGIFSTLRDYLSSKINLLLPQPQAALLDGILLGQKASLPWDFRQALTSTSTIHIVVVSGQNLTLLAGFLMGFKGLLGRKKTLALALVVIVAYSFLTGLQIPVIRAAVMVGFTFLAQFFNRESDSKYVLLLTAGVMLIYNPAWINSLSFQLSFLATIAVVIVAPILAERLKALPEFVNQDLSVSLAAQVLTLPVIAYNFYEVSIVGILVNSLILFTIPIIMITGVLALLAGLVNLSLGIILAAIPNLFLTYFIYVVNLFNQRWGTYIFPSTNYLVWVGYYFLVYGVFLWLKKGVVVGSSIKIKDIA